MVKLTDKRRPKYDCDRCEDKGWYFRVPDNFNPFFAGGFSTARAMYRVNCNCAFHAARATFNDEGASNG